MNINKISKNFWLFLYGVTLLGCLEQETYQASLTIELPTESISDSSINFFVSSRVQTLKADSFSFSRKERSIKLEIYNLKDSNDIRNLFVRSGELKIAANQTKYNGEQYLTKMNNLLKSEGLFQST